MKSKRTRPTVRKSLHQRAVKCGKCGKVGHNVRTCGKSTHPHTPPLSGNTSRNISSSPHHVVKNAQNGKGIDEVVEHLGNLTNPASNDDAHLYTVEDLETLWEIQSGRYGVHTDHMGITIPAENGENIATQWETGDTLALVELVHTMTASDEVDISVEQWGKFLYKFSNNARANLVAGFLKSSTYHEKPNFPKYTLPPQIFYALQNDPHPQVRIHLARSRGIPENVALKLVKDPHADVFVETLRNKDVTGKVLEKGLHVADRSEESTPSERDWTNRVDRKGWKNANHRAHEAISTHPNLTQNIIKIYKERNDSQQEDYYPYNLAISNPNLDTTHVTEVFTQALKKRDMAQAELDTMKRTPPPRAVWDPVQARENELDGEVRRNNAKLRSATSNPNLPAHLFTQFVNPQRYTQKPPLIHHTQFADPRISTKQCEQYAVELVRLKQWEAVGSLADNPNVNEATKKFLTNVLKSHTSPLRGI